jgi:hypothetical protein
LNSSIHSSLDEASVPDQATSLIRIVPGGTGRGVGALVEVPVVVEEGVMEGVSVTAGSVGEESAVGLLDVVMVGSMLGVARFVGVVVAHAVPTGKAEAVSEGMAAAV